MDRDSQIVTIRGMIAQNPVEITFDPASQIPAQSGSSETHDGGVANVAVSERQVMVGKEKSYRRSVWIITDDWTTLPAKRNVISIASVNYRVLDLREYYPDTDGDPVALRLDLGAEFETGRD